MNKKLGSTILILCVILMLSMFTVTVMADGWTGNTEDNLSTFFSYHPCGQGGGSLKLALSDDSSLKYNGTNSLKLIVQSGGTCNQPTIRHVFTPDYGFSLYAGLAFEIYSNVSANNFQFWVYSDNWANQLSITFPVQLGWTHFYLNFADYKNFDWSQISCVAIMLGTSPAVGNTYWVDSFRLVQMEAKNTYLNWDFEYGCLPPNNTVAIYGEERQNGSTLDLTHIITLGQYACKSSVLEPLLYKRATLNWKPILGPLYLNRACFSVSVYLPSNFTLGTQANWVMMYEIYQTHNATDYRILSWLVIEQNGIDTPRFEIESNSQGSSSMICYWNSTEAVQVGCWHQFICELTYGQNGEVRLWHRLSTDTYWVEKADVHYDTRCFSMSADPYFITGLYKRAIVSPPDWYIFDNIKVSQTLSDAMGQANSY